MEHFLAIFGENTLFELHCENMQESFGGSSYHKWSISIAMLNYYCNTDDIAHYCLLLPQMTSVGVPKVKNEATFMRVESIGWAYKMIRHLGFPGHLTLSTLYN